MERNPIGIRGQMKMYQRGAGKRSRMLRELYRIMELTERVLQANPGCDPGVVRLTLLCLREAPITRLGWSLFRAGRNQPRGS